MQRTQSPSRFSITRIPGFKYLLGGIKLLISAACFVWLYFTLRERSNELPTWHVFLECLLIFVPLIILQTALLGWRLKLCMESNGIQIPLSQMMIASFVGNFFVQTIPVFVAGDLIKAFHIKDKMRSAQMDIPVTSFVAWDRLVGLATMLLLVGLMAPVWLRLYGLAENGMGWLAAFIAIFAALAAPFIIRAICSKMHQGKGAWFSLLSAGRAITAKPLHSYKIIFISLLSQILIIAGFQFASHLAGLPLSLFQIWSTLPIALLIALIPVSLGGWGTRESALLILFHQAGWDAVGGHMVMLSVTFGVSAILASLPGGVLWLMGRKEAKTGLNQAG